MDEPKRLCYIFCHVLSLLRSKDLETAGSHGCGWMNIVSRCQRWVVRGATEQILRWTRVEMLVWKVWNRLGHLTKGNNWNPRLPGRLYIYIASSLFDLFWKLSQDQIATLKVLKFRRKFSCWHVPPSRTTCTVSSHFRTPNLLLPFFIFLLCSDVASSTSLAFARCASGFVDSLFMSIWIYLKLFGFSSQVCFALLRSNVLLSTRVFPSLEAQRHFLRLFLCHFFDTC